MKADFLIPLLIIAVGVYLLLFGLQSSFDNPPEHRPHIVVVTSEKRVYLRKYEGINHREIPMTAGGTDSPTSVGTFEVLSKLENVESYHGYTFPLWIGVYSVGGYENGIHSVMGENPWDMHIGWKNATPGSVIVSEKHMQEIYDWAEVGMEIIIIN